MKKLRRFIGRLLLSKGALAFFSALSAVSALMLYAARCSFVFTDNAIFDGFMLGLFVFIVIGGIYLLAFLNIKARGIKAAPKPLMYIAALLSEILALAGIIYTVVSVIVDRFMNLSTTLALMKEALPAWLFITGCAFFAFMYPLITARALKKAVAVCSAAVLLFTAYAFVFPVTPYKFTSGPVVFDNGDAYTVSFSTSDTGTGYIEYEYGGETVRKYDSSGGRKNGSSVIHSVTVPKEQLSGNTYKVGSARVIDELSYGGRIGKTIESESYSFSDSFGEDIDVLTLSDWHTKNELALKTASALGEYQAVILLGDCAPGLMSENDIAKYILDFAHELTGGEMPVIYVRGNHETRGTEAGALGSYLGFDEYYYTTMLGEYKLIVLDSCEDKEDSHPEYGDMADYEAYRREMTNWLEGLDSSGEKTIALCHSKNICIEEELKERSHKKLEALNTSLLVSGHSHSVEFNEDGAYPVFVDGGIDSCGRNTYAASMLHIGATGIELETCDNSAKTVLSESVSWK